jgi:hypothetical protein
MPAQHCGNRGAFAGIMDMVQPEAASMGQHRKWQAHGALQGPEDP